MSKAKGNRAENEVAKILKKWWGADFQRTPMSGGSRLKEGWDLAGDLTCADSQFPFSIECKKREGWDLHQLFVSDICAPWKWWGQTLEDTPPGKRPLMVFWKNRYPKLVMMDLENFDIGPTTGIAKFAVLRESVVFLLDDLLKTDPEKWKELYED